MLESSNRHMPHSTDAEQAILGAMLLDEKVCEDVKLKLQPYDFYHHRHRIIYEAMLTLLEQHKGVDVTTVTAYLQDHKRDKPENFCSAASIKSCVDVSGL